MGIKSFGTKNWLIAQHVLETAEAHTRRTWRALRAHLLDCRLHVLWEEGLVYFPDGALESCGRVLGSTENRDLASCDRGAVLGGRFAAK